MYQLDDVQLYDLSEAGRLLYRDPVRLTRQARHRRIPSVLGPEGLGLPAPWVEAQAGTRPEDPEALRRQWLERLAPPSPDAARAAQPLSALPIHEVLTPEEAAARLMASPAALQRMDEDGHIPSLRVDGVRRYDAVFITWLSVEANGDEVDPVAIDTRRAELRVWARFQYERVPGTDEGEAPPAAPRRIIQAEGFETVEDDD